MAAVLSDGDIRVQQRAAIRLIEEQSRPIAADFWCKTLLGAATIAVPWVFAWNLGVKAASSIVGVGCGICAFRAASKLERKAEEIERRENDIQFFESIYKGTQATVYQKKAEQLLEAMFLPQQPPQPQQQLPEWYGEASAVNQALEFAGIKAWVYDRELTASTVRWILKWEKGESIGNIEKALSKRAKEFTVIGGLHNPKLGIRPGALYLEVPREFSFEDEPQREPEYVQAAPTPVWEAPRPHQSISFEIGRSTSPQNRSATATPQREPQIVITDWAQAVVDGSIPSKYRWIRDFINYPCVLVHGAQGAGKSGFARFLARCRILAGHKLEVWNPHGKFGEWKGLKIVGQGLDYAAIDEAMLQFGEAVRDEYEKLSTIEGYEPEYRSIVVEELTNYATRCEQSGEFQRTSYSDIRKAGLCVIFIAHDRTLAATGGASGLSQARDNSTLELRLLNRIDPQTSLSVPANRGKLRMPGSKQWIDVEIPAWMNGAEDFSDIADRAKAVDPYETFDAAFEDKFGFDPDDTIEPPQHSTTPDPGQANDIYGTIAAWLAANPNASAAAVKLKFRSLTKRDLKDEGLQALLEYLSQHHPEAKAVCDRLLGI